MNVGVKVLQIPSQPSRAPRSYPCIKATNLPRFLRLFYPVRPPLQPPHIPSLPFLSLSPPLPLSLSPRWHFQRGCECLNFAHQPHYGASKPSIDFKGRSFEFLITRMYGCCAQQLSDARHMRTRPRTGTGESNAHILSSPLLQLYFKVLCLLKFQVQTSVQEKKKGGGKKKTSHPAPKKGGG